MIFEVEGKRDPMKETCSLMNLEGIKVCRISTVPFFLVAQLRNQVEYMRDMGMDVVLVSSHGPELSDMKFGPGLTHEIIEIPRSLRPYQDFIAFFKLINFLSKHKFNIVHSTTPKAGLLTAMAAFFIRVPIRLHTWTGQQWVTLNGPMRWCSRLADKLIGALNTQCYADSKSQRQFLIDEKIVDSGKISVIGEGSLAGVDLARFHSERWSLVEKRKLRESLNISSDSKIFVFIGRMTRDKGVVELVSAFIKILGLGYHVDLLLVGPFDQECGGKRSVDISLINQNSRIHYVGQQKCPEYYLSISDIFCLPSYREGFGTTVIEAAAMGLPTIGTRINGLVDAVQDGITGILVNAYDSQSVVNAMRRLLDDPELMRSMGKAARARCQDLFDVKVLNKKLIEEYGDLLQRSGARESRK